MRWSGGHQNDIIFDGTQLSTRIVTMIFTEIPLERVNQSPTVKRLPGPSIIMSRHGLTFIKKHNSSPAWQKVSRGRFAID